MTILFYCMVDEEGIITNAYYNEGAIPQQQYDYFIYNMDAEIIADIENFAKYKVSQSGRDISVEKVADAPEAAEEIPEEATELEEQTEEEKPTNT